MNKSKAEEFQANKDKHTEILKASDALEKLIATKHWKVLEEFLFSKEVLRLTYMSRSSYLRDDVRADTNKDLDSLIGFKHYIEWLQLAGNEAKNSIQRLEEAEEAYLNGSEDEGDEYE